MRSGPRGSTAGLRRPGPRHAAPAVDYVAGFSARSGRSYRQTSPRTARVHDMPGMRSRESDGPSSRSSPTPSPGSPSSRRASPPRGAAARRPSAASPQRRASVGHTGLLDWQTDGSLNLVGKFPISSPVLAIEVVGSLVWTSGQDGSVTVRQMNGVAEASIPKDPLQGKVFALHWNQVLCSSRACKTAGAFPAGEGRGCQCVWVGYSTGLVRVYGVGPDSSKKPSKYLLLEAHEHAQQASVTHFHGSRATNYICSASQDGTIVVWDGFELRYLRSIRQGTRAVKSMCSTKDPPVLYSAGDDGVIKAWKLSDAADVGTVVGTHDGRRPVNAILISRQNPKLLWSASDDKTIRVWDITSQSQKPKAIIRGRAADRFDVPVTGLLDLGHIVIANDGRGNIQSFAAHPPFNPFKKYRRPGSEVGNGRSANIRSINATAQHLVNRVWTADASKYISVWFDEVRGEDDRVLSTEEIQQTLAGNYQALLADTEQAMQAALDRAAAEAEELREQAQQREEDARELQTALQEQQRDMESERGAGERRLADMQQSLGNREQQVVGLTEDLGQKDREVAGLVRELQSKDAALEQRGEMVSRLQQQVRNLEDDLRAAVAMKEDAEQQGSDAIRGYELTAESTQVRASELQELNDRQRETISQMQGDIDVLDTQLREAEDRARRAEGLAASAVPPNQQYEREQAWLQRLQESEDRWRADRSGLEGEIADLRNRLSLARDDVAKEREAAHASLTSAERGASFARDDQIALLEEQLQESDAARRGAEDELVRLAGELRLERDTRIRLEARLGELATAAPVSPAPPPQESTERLIQMEAKLAEAGKHIDVYEKLVDALKEKLAEKAAAAKREEVPVDGGGDLAVRSQVETLERLNEEKNAVIAQQICALDAKCERIRLQEISCSEVRKLADANIAAYHNESLKCKHLEQQLRELMSQQPGARFAAQHPQAAAAEPAAQFGSQQREVMAAASQFGGQQRDVAQFGAGAATAGIAPDRAQTERLQDAMTQHVAQIEILTEQLTKAEADLDEACARAEEQECVIQELRVDLKAAELRQTRDVASPTDGDATRALPGSEDPALELQAARSAAAKLEHQATRLREQVRLLEENRDQFKELSDDQFNDILELEQQLQRLQAENEAAREQVRSLGAVPVAVEPEPAEAAPRMVAGEPVEYRHRGSVHADPQQRQLSGNSPARSSPARSVHSRSGSAASPARDVRDAASASRDAASHRSHSMSPSQRQSRAGRDLSPSPSSSPPSRRQSAQARSASMTASEARRQSRFDDGSADRGVVGPVGRTGDVSTEICELQLALRHKDELNDILKQDNVRLTRELEELVKRNEDLSQDRVQTEHAAATALLDQGSLRRASRVDDLLRQQQEERIAQLEAHLTKLSDDQSDDSAARDQLECVKKVVNELTQRLDLKESRIHEETMVRIQLERQVKDAEIEKLSLQRQLQDAEAAWGVRSRGAAAEQQAGQGDHDTQVLRERVAELQHRYEEARRDLLKADEELLAARAAQSDHEYVVAVLKEEVEKERSQRAADADRASVDRLHLEGAVAQAESRLRGRDERLRMDAQASREERSHLNVLQVEHEGEVRALRKELTDYKYEAMSLLEQLEAEKKLRSLERQREGLLDERTERDVRAVVEELQVQLTRQQDTVTELRVHKNLLLQQLDACRDEERERKFVRDREVSDLNSMLEEKAERERLLAHQQEMLQAEVDRLCLELRQKEKEKEADRVRFHERETELMRGHERDVEKLQTGVMRMDTEMLSSQTELARLQQTERANRERVEQARVLEEDMNAEMSRLRGKYTERVAELEDTVRAKERKIADLIATTQGLEAEIEVLRGRCAELDRHATGRVGINQQEDDLIQRQRRKLEERDEEIDLLNQLNRERLVRIQALEAERDAAVGTTEAQGDLRKRLRLSEEARDELARELAVTRDDLQSARTELRDLDTLLDSRRKTAAGDEAQTADLRRRIREYEVDLQSKEEQISKLRAGLRKRSPERPAVRRTPSPVTGRRSRQGTDDLVRQLEDHHRQSARNRELDDELVRSLQCRPAREETRRHRFARPIPVDLTGDGRADAVGYDTTGDGRADVFDTNLDGRPDMVLRPK
eukprot:TRINITY_DN9703_c0_g2_i1.p1 TRINITY_DN9703_c0_g2~~TRINITY_DN9703_c0_g2_i1.p1  ORF type:complete len:2115 (+),score=790.88 TRINITY_DN9703_c0_g2_i1:109-6453(+)